MKQSHSTLLATALVGAAGGALAVYLFDPQAGQARRQRIGETAGGALETTRRGLETLAGQARHHAQHARDIAASTINDAAKTAKESAHAHLAETSAAIAAQAHGLGERLLNHVHETADPWRDRGRRTLAAWHGQGQGSRALPLIFTAVGFSAAGVGLMWLMDPDRGRSRRAQLAQRAAHVLRKTGREFNRTGRHLRNKMTGYAAVAGHSMARAVSPEAMD
jgi:gas vesicle protein